MDITVNNDVISHATALAGRAYDRLYDEAARTKIIPMIGNLEDFVMSQYTTQIDREPDDHFLDLHAFGSGRVSEATKRAMRVGSTEAEIEEHIVRCRRAATEGAYHAWALHFETFKEVLVESIQEPWPRGAETEPY